MDEGIESNLLADDELIRGVVAAVFEAVIVGLHRVCRGNVVLGSIGLGRIALGSRVVFEGIRVFEVDFGLAEMATFFVRFMFERMVGLFTNSPVGRCCEMAPVSWVLALEVMLLAARGEDVSLLVRCL